MTLFADDTPAAKLAPHRVVDRETLFLYPYVALRIYPDGSADGECPIHDAEWSRLETQARDRIHELREHIKFLERWIAAPKRGERPGLRV